MLILMIYSGIGVILMAAGVIAGIYLRRKAVFVRSFAGYVVPAVLLLTMVLLLLWREQLIPPNLNPVTIPVALAGLAAVAAIFCAFCPNWAAFVLAAMTGLAGFWIMMLRNVSGFPMNWTAIAGSACYGVVLLLSCMGIALPKQAPATGRRDGYERGPARKERMEPQEKQRQESQKESQDELQKERQPVGSLTLLAEPFVGGQIPLAGGEELRMGSDATCCHLILELPGRQPCLCGVRWLARRNTYLITSYTSSGLLYGEGRPLPCNSSVEASPGSVFLEGQTGQALFRVG